MPYKIRNKIQFLAEASKILASSLDYNTTLNSIAHLIVNNMADFCMIDLLQKNGKMDRVAARVADHSQQKLAEEMFRFPADPRNKQGIYEAARTSKPILVEKLSLSWLKKATRLTEEQELVKKLGMHSFMFVPLKSRRKVIGVLSIVSSNQSYSYSKEDVALAEELAGRAGIAVDNARLFSESQEALKTRDLFISMAAHELRTPLTSISGYIQLLYSKLANTDSIEAKWIKELSWESYRLIKLVNELLAVDQIKSGHLKYVWKECSLRDILNRALTDFSFIFPNYQITLVDKVKGDKDRIIGDYDKILQVILNLLDNAAKFSPENSEILVTLRYHSPHVILSVQDKGRGIPNTEITRIFEKFYQGTDHNTEGLGIGLFLVKNIITQHHGTVHISSERGKGTTVEIKLPQLVYLTK